MRWGQYEMGSGLAIQQSRLSGFLSFPNHYPSDGMASVSLVSLVSLVYLVYLSLILWDGRESPWATGNETSSGSNSTSLTGIR